jgi:hypothetical protein
MHEESFYPPNIVIPYEYVIDIDKPYDSMCSTCKNKCDYDIVTKSVVKIGITKKEKLLKKSGSLFAVTDCSGHIK